MSNNKQSSIEWLQAIELERDLTLADWNKAKAMHKSEIIWSHGIKMKGVNNLKCVSGEQYYKETFGGKQ